MVLVFLIGMGCGALALAAFAAIRGVLEERRHERAHVAQCKAARRSCGIVIPEDIEAVRQQRGAGPIRVVARGGGGPS